MIATPTTTELVFVSPEMTLAATSVAVMLAPFLLRKHVNVVGGAITCIGLLIALGFALVTASPHGAMFSGLVTADSAAMLWKRLLLIFMIGVLGIWSGSTRRMLSPGDAPEFFVLMLSAAVGMMLMGETTHLLMMVLAMEIASMPSYVLAAFRKRNRRSAESGLKFVLFGAVATATMLYGMSLLYGSGGSLELTTIARAQANGISGMAGIGLLLLLMGLLFKVSAVPMHFWCPDVFEGAPVDVAAFLSVASKGAAIVLLLRLTTAWAEAAPATEHGVMQVLAVIAVITTTVGNFGALRQNSVRRILAYSSIAHAGYMLSALALLEPGRAAVIAYLIIYAVMNAGAFAVLSEVESDAGSDDVKAFNGLIARSPSAALALAICLVSLVGLPPAVGFFAKWNVLASLARAGGAWWVVAASVAINSIVSLVYYARILKAAFLQPAETPARLQPSWARLVSVGCGALLILLLVRYAWLDKTATDAASGMIVGPYTSK